MKREKRKLEFIKSFVDSTYNKWGRVLVIKDEGEYNPLSNDDSALACCSLHTDPDSKNRIFTIRQRKTGKEYTDFRILMHEYGHIYEGHLLESHKDLDSLLMGTLIDNRNEIADSLMKNVGLSYADSISLINRVIDDPSLNHSIHNIAMDFHVNSNVLSLEDIEEMESELGDIIKEAQTKEIERIMSSSEEVDESVINKMTEEVKNRRSEDFIKLMHPNRYHFKDGTSFPDDLTYADYLLLMLENLDQFVKMLVSLKKGDNGDTSDVSLEDIIAALNGMLSQRQNRLNNNNASQQYKDGYNQALRDFNNSMNNSQSNNGVSKEFKEGFKQGVNDFFDKLNNDLDKVSNNPDFKQGFEQGISDMLDSLKGNNGNNTQQGQNGQQGNQGNGQGSQGTQGSQCSQSGQQGAGQCQGSQGQGNQGNGQGQGASAGQGSQGQNGQGQGGNNVSNSSDYKDGYDSAKSNGKINDNFVNGQGQGSQGQDQGQGAGQGGNNVSDSFLDGYNSAIQKCLESSQQGQQGQQNGQGQDGQGSQGQGQNGQSGNGQDEFNQGYQDALRDLANSNGNGSVISGSSGSGNESANLNGFDNLMRDSGVIENKEGVDKLDIDSNAHSGKGRYHSDCNSDNRSEADELRHVGKIIAGGGLGCSKFDASNPTRDVITEGLDDVDMALREVVSEIRERVVKRTLHKDTMRNYNRGVNRSVISSAITQKINISKNPKIVYLLDISGSMNTELVDRILQTIKNCMYKINRDLTYDIITWNTRLGEHLKDISSKNPVPKISYGGGTDIAGGIEYFHNNYGKDAVLVIISDFEDDLDEWHKVESTMKGYSLWGFNYGVSGYHSRSKDKDWSVIKQRDFKYYNYD
jgi:hypothetical protein